MPHYPDMRIVVTKQVPLDSFQAVDMKSDLIDLRGKSCVHQDGDRVRFQVAKASHTLTKIAVECKPDVGLNLMAQAARLNAVLEVINEAQKFYTPAAIDCDISLGPPAQDTGRTLIGQIDSQIKTSPPVPRSAWTEDTVNLPVSGRPGWRIIVKTDHILGPTLDRWSTLWYAQLCQEVKEMTLSYPWQQPMWSFQWELPSFWMQHITFKIQAFSVQGCEPSTVRVFTAVMDTLFVLFARQGARPLRFNLVSNQDCHVGVGYMEFGDLPPELQLGNQTTLNTATAIQNS